MRSTDGVTACLQVETQLSQASLGVRKLARALIVFILAYTTAYMETLTIAHVSHRQSTVLTPLFLPPGSVDGWLSQLQQSLLGMEQTTACLQVSMCWSLLTLLTASLCSSLVPSAPSLCCHCVAAPRAVPLLHLCGQEQDVHCRQPVLCDLLLCQLPPVHEDRREPPGNKVDAGTGEGMLVNTLLLVCCFWLQRALLAKQ